MSIFDIIFLIIATVILAAVVGTYLTKGQPSLKDLYREVKPKKDITMKGQDLVDLHQSAQDLVKELDRVTGKNTTPEQSKQLAKDLVDIATTSPKKKRKYYPKKK
jgi:hypothetical protein